MSISPLITSDTNVFVNSIRKRPALYIAEHVHFHDTEMKKRLWIEVCKEVVEDWQKLDVNTKNLIGRDVQKKWHVIRSNANNMLSQNTDGRIPAAKRKRSMSDNLQSLEPTINTSDEDEEQIANKELLVEREPNKFNSKSVYLHELFLHVLNQESDEDKQFTLSLVPMLKSLQDNDKLQAKIEILQVLQKIKSKSLV